MTWMCRGEDANDVNIWYIWRWWLFNVSIRCWSCVWKESCWKWAIKIIFMNSIIKIIWRKERSILNEFIIMFQPRIGQSNNWPFNSRLWATRCSSLTWQNPHDVIRLKAFHESNCSTHTPGSYHQPPSSPPTPTPPPPPANDITHPSLNEEINSHQWKRFNYKINIIFTFAIRDWTEWTPPTNYIRQLLNM